MTLSINEQKAVMQCLWQVLAANPTPSENNYIQTKLLHKWDALMDVDMSDAAILRFTLGCEVLPWIMVAIQEDPYESFDKIRKMSDDKKQIVKQLVLNLLDNVDSYSERAPYAHTLFENCSIPFGIMGSMFPDGHFGNKLV